MLSLAPLTIHARVSRPVCGQMIREIHRIAPGKYAISPLERRRTRRYAPGSGVLLDPGTPRADRCELGRDVQGVERNHHGDNEQGRSDVH